MILILQKGKLRHREVNACSGSQVRHSGGTFNPHKLSASQDPSHLPAVTTALKCCVTLEQQVPR